MDTKPKKLPTYRLEGGLGKIIIFSSLIKKLVKKHNSKINIISSYDDIFIFNPNVENSFNSLYFETNNKECMLKVSEIIYHEPYKTHYMYNDEHILKNWCKQFNIEYSENDTPDLYLNDELKKQANALLKELGTFSIVQFSGGQPPIEFNENNYYDIQGNIMRLQRNYPQQMGGILCRKLMNHNEHRIINFTLPNEPDISATERIVQPYLLYHELCKHAKYIICIDSSLQHIAAAANVKATVLWNADAQALPNKIGYELHDNIVARNMEIDYDSILNSIIK